MSQNQELDLSVMPKEVEELRQVLMDFSDYHKALMDGQFPGKASKVIDKLLDHVYDVYKQTLVQYNEHPWVIADRIAKEKEQLEAQRES